MNTTITEIPLSEIKPFVRRARPAEPFNRLKESIKEIGLRMPIQVRELPRRKDGYKYELIVGQGRMQAFKELRKDSIPAIVVDVPEGEIVGRFLAENVMRRRLSWQEKARLLKEEVSRIGMPTKADLEVLAKRYFITPAYVAKLINILKQASPKVQGDLDSMTVTEAETLTSLPARNQDIVIETMREEAIPAHEMPVVARQAKKLAQSGGELNKTALKATLRRVGEDLGRLRQSMKPIRLHHSLGPANLQMLLSDKAFRKAMDKKKINYSKFESETI